MIDHLLIATARGTEAVALADDCRGSAASNGILSPSLIVVIDDMEVPEAAPAGVAQHVGLGAHLQAKTHIEINMPM